MDSFGNNFRVTLFGESHGEAIGVVVDGARAGIPLCAEDFLPDISRRSPGEKGTTARKEADIPEILSGVYDSHTTGAPIAILFRNNDTRSSDYSRFRDIPRPGHADYSASLKWSGNNDIRGGGHFSGRLTLPLVAAGVIARKMAGETSFKASVVEIGGSSDKGEWDALISGAASEGDSLGAVVECRIDNLPAGIGEPFFNSVESLLSHAVFSIPGVRGIEFGDGFAAAAMKGSQHNDPFGPDGPVKNGAGGVNGGISNGAPVVFRVAFKPTSSISKTQRTWDFSKGTPAELSVSGRHDVCFALRTPVIVEAVAAIVIADFLSGKGA